MILFVDDEPFFIKSFEEALEAEGFVVAVQRRIAMAMAVVESPEQNIELIITDVMMPADDKLKREDLGDSDLTAGFALFDWIRARLPSIPIIVLTNKTTGDVDHEFNTKPNCAVIRKQACTPFKLVKLVKQMLSHNPVDEFVK